MGYERERRVSIVEHKSRWQRVKHSAVRRLEQLRHPADPRSSAVGQRTVVAANVVAANVAPLAEFLAAPELLEWIARATRSAATIYDRALDAEYLRTHVGGGNHRLFDGGHDLWGAWTRVRSASPHDSLLQEVMGYSHALWQDLTTPKGLPFVTWDIADYQKLAHRLGNAPGVSRSWIYDALTYDVFELFAAGLGAIGLIFALQRNDLVRLSEMLGSMGVTAILSANPLLGLALIATVGHAYWKATSNRASTVVLDHGAVLRGVALAGSSATVFAVLTGPVAIKLIVALVVAGFLRKFTEPALPSSVCNNPTVSFTKHPYIHGYDRSFIDSMRL